MRIAWEKIEADKLKVEAELRDANERIVELEIENALLLEEIDRLANELQGLDL
jgi:predicted nuclease with TOPRIM domain